MLTIQEKHQIQRDSLVEFIITALKAIGLISADNIRTMNLKDLHTQLKAIDFKVCVEGLTVFVSLADVDYAMKKAGIKVKRSGLKRTRVEAVSADTSADSVSAVDSGIEVGTVEPESEDTDNMHETSVESTGVITPSSPVEEVKSVSSVQPDAAVRHLVRRIIRKPMMKGSDAETVKTAISSALMPKRRPMVIPDCVAKNAMERRGMVYAQA